MARTLFVGNGKDDDLRGNCLNTFQKMVSISSGSLITDRSKSGSTAKNNVLSDNIDFYLFRHN